MMTAERRRQILDVLATDARAEVPALALRFGVSESTIRRDLQVLSQDGAVERTLHGAASISLGLVRRPVVVFSPQAGLF